MTAVPVHTMPETTALDDATLQLYALVVNHSRIDVDILSRESGLSRSEAAEGLAQLNAARLVQPLTGTVGEYRPAPPDWAESHLLTPVVSELQAQQRLVDETRRTLQLLASSYRQIAVAEPQDTGIAVLRPGHATRRAFGELVDTCQDSYLAVHAIAAAPYLSDDIVADELAMAHRGVQVQSLVPSSAVLKLTTRSYVRELTRAGAHVRSAAHLWLELILFDRTCAVVSAAMPDDHGTCLLVVRHPALVARICEFSDHVWGTSTSLGTPAGAIEQTTTLIAPGTIARMLASGCTDDVAARRLNMSLRTYRRHVAALMNQLGARTRFQAGLLVQAQGLLSA